MLGSYSASAGEVHRRGCIWRAGARHKRLSYDDFFGYFLVRRQESNAYR